MGWIVRRIAPVGEPLHDMCIVSTPLPIFFRQASIAPRASGTTRAVTARNVCRFVSFYTMHRSSFARSCNVLTGNLRYFSGTCFWNAAWNMLVETRGRRWEYQRGELHRGSSFRGHPVGIPVGIPREATSWKMPRDFSWGVPARFFMMSPRGTPRAMRATPLLSPHPTPTPTSVVTQYCRNMRGGHAVSTPFLRP